MEKIKRKKKEDEHQINPQEKENMNGNSTVGIINSDLCGSCHDGGDLICCDSCPKSFHFDCINPPLAPEKAQELKNWYCASCSSKKLPKELSNSILSPLFQKLSSSNSEVFVLPPEVINTVTANTTSSSSINASEKLNENSEESESKTRKKFTKREKNVPSKEDVCSICSQIGGTQLILCSTCNKAFHTYCLDPPLLFRPVTPWTCPSHQTTSSVNKPKESEVLPDHSFKLDFLPPEMKKLRTSPSPIDASELEQTNWLLSLSNSIATSESLQMQLDQLQKEQTKLFQSALPSQININQLTSNSLAQSPLVLTQFTPLFIQFLAWQRLIEVNYQIQQIQTNLNEMKQKEEHPHSSQTSPESMESELSNRSPSPSEVSLQGKNFHNANENEYSKSTLVINLNQDSPIQVNDVLSSESISSDLTIQEGKKQDMEENEEEKEEKEEKEVQPHKKRKLNIIPSVSSSNKSNFSFTPSSSTNSNSISYSEFEIMAKKPIEEFKNPIAIISVGGSKNYEMKKSKMLIGRKKFGPNFQNSFVDIPMSDLNQKLRTISRKHAYIHYNSDRQIFFLQSLGRNGTKVDGVVQKGFVQLKPNSSKIEIGKQLLTLELKK